MPRVEDVMVRIARLTRQDGSCVLFVGTHNRKGYGQIRFQGRLQFVHRIVYEARCGPIDSNLVIDHLCRRRNCVNSDHMEAVPNKTNVLRGIGPTAINARKQHCIRGHALEGANIRIDKNGWRVCRACARMAFHLSVARHGQPKRRARTEVT